MLNQRMNAGDPQRSFSAPPHEGWELVAATGVQVAVRPVADGVKMVSLVIGTNHRRLLGVVQSTPQAMAS